MCSKAILKEGFRRGRNFLHEEGGNLFQFFILKNAGGYLLLDF